MVLKVQCDACAARYKLDESRIKGKGARITCPKCGHQFVVYKRGLQHPDFDEDEPATIIASQDQLFAPGALSSATMRRAELLGQANPQAPETTPAPQAPPAPAAPEAPPRVARPASATTLNWREVGLTSFKVKVSFGLVYDFSDVSTLKKYIADKKVQNTDSISMDGKTWLLLGELGDLDTWFIDQWVELKEAQLEGDTTPPSAPSKARPEDAPTVELADPDPVQPSASEPRLISPDTLEGTLKGDDLFTGLAAEDLTTPDLAATLAPRRSSPPPDPIAEPEYRGVDVGAHVQPAPPRKPLMGRGEAAVLVLLIALAGVLGWAWSSGALASSVQEAQAFDAGQDKTQVKEQTQVLFPSLGAAPLAAPPAEVIPPPVAQPEEGSAPSDAVGETTGAGDPSAAKAAPRKQKKKAGVKTASISAKDLEELGDALMSGGDAKGAADAYSKAVGMKPSSSTYQLKLGRAQLAAGQTSSAQRSLKQALKLNPGLVDAHKYLGEAFEKMGQREDAAAAYRRYLESKPGAGDRAEIEARLSRLG